MSVYRTKGERISMKKFKIKTNLVSGVIMGVAALLLIILLPSQVRVPAYDSGAPSPRIIPGICLAIMQEKVVEFDWAKEKPAILLILGMCVYIGLMLCIGYVLASLIVFPLALFYVGERKPGPYIVVLVSAFAIFLLFKNVFNISLPALGLLGGII